jgi:hydroxymethylpyrimidine pyrophosphatase-like HAD family hydrolase
MSTGEYLDAKLIEPDAGLRMIEVLREIDPGMSFAVEVANPRADFIIDHSYRPRWEPLDAPPRMHPEDMMAGGNVVKLLARPSHGSQHDADSILIAAQEVAAGVVDITHSDLTDLLLEMSALGVNKGSGLAEVAAARNIARDDVAAVGDMPNDIPMITWAGRGAAVANAHDWVKAAADEHLPTNDEHAVSVFIDRLLNEG